MNKFQALAALIIEEVRAAELASLNSNDPAESDMLVLERVEAFLRANLSDTSEPSRATEKPDDYLTVEDPSADVDLKQGDRWKWTPEADA